MIALWKQHILAISVFSAMAVYIPLHANAGLTLITLMDSAISKQLN